MRRLTWIGRTPEHSAETVDEALRRRVPEMPPGLPVEGWKAERGGSVIIGTEHFLGATPVWVWQE